MSDVFWVLVAFGIQPATPIPAKAEVHYTLESCVKAGRKMEVHIKKQVTDGWVQRYFLDCIRVEVPRTRN